MEDYSVEAYLHRRSTEQLQIFLWQCMQFDQWDQYAEKVPLIMDILKMRGEKISGEVMVSWSNFKDRRR